ncbi:Ig-like domain-containing protein [Chryseolinea sp. H1M3-3]|uniref:Ig-like domain-containing protein n=1 Tax=Chryseolinea sp. H1M3-3 TaxID=3034144 RepID=UPI0023ED41D2|nr:Ig-like domain-containing protein [Chryseolinea sp. H1M3-3]
MMRRLGILLLFIVCFQSAFATVYHVSVSGNDNGDGSVGNPWRTLKVAVTKVPAGQGHTIKLSAGTFVESGQFNVPPGVNIEGAGVDQTIIKSASGFYYNPASPGFGLDKFLMWVYSANAVAGNQSLKNFTLDGDGKRLHGGIYVKNRSNILIENVKVQGTNFCGIWIWDVKNSILRDVTIINCSWGSTGWAAGALQLAHLEDVELVGLNIDENTGYGIKALSGGGNKITRMKVHDSRITVNPAGKWANGSAPNISFELWEVLLTDCEIYNNYMDNHLSLVNVPTTPTGGRSVRVHHNVFDLLTRAGGHGYSIESTVNDVEIDHNWFNGGSYGIANWSPTRVANWYIHHNTFTNLNSGWPGTVMRSNISGLHNVKFYNNTVELSGTTTINVIGLHAGPSDNVDIKNNLFIDSNTSYSWWPNPLIFMEGGATMSGLVVSHNLFQKMPIGTISGSYSNNLTVDPQITKSGVKPSPYYLPRAGSPLIDAGVNVGLPYQGSAPDIGAHEFGAATPPVNQMPTVSLTAPANNTNFPAGSSITINATASDPGGSVSKVEFYNGATKLGEDLTSPYSFVWANVPAGNYTISAKATDNQSGTTTSSPVNISVTNANTLPVVSITSPVNNATFTTGSTVNITANASDANGTVSKVEFFNGAVKLGEDLTSPYSFSWTNVQAGTHSITAKATDNQGGVTTSTAIRITVNTANTPPVVSITSPLPNATFAPGATVSIAATASDINGSIGKVEFFNGNTKLGEDLTSPYSFTWQNVASGTYRITARATDNQQAISTSQQITIIVTAGNTPPTVTLTSPANNASFATGTPISITANAADPNGSVTKVEFFNGAVKLGEDLTTPYSYVINNPAAGNYSVTAKATDNAGAVSTSAITRFSVQNSTTGASVVLTSPLNGSTFDAGSSIQLTATATALSGAISKVEFYRGTTKIGEDLTSPYTFIWNNVAAGNYNLTARATDNLAKIVTSAAVNIIVSNPGGPTVNITSPVNNASLPVGSTITIVAEALSSGGTISKVEFFNGTVKLGEDDTSPYNYSWSNVQEGTYTLSAKATDALGNNQTDEIQIFVKSTPIAYAGDDVTVVLPQTTVEISGKGESSDGSDLSYSWSQISGPNDASISDANSSSPTFENLIEGLYVFELTITDSNGVTASDQVAVEVTNPPMLSEGNIPRYFSPNADGINDVWEWPSLDLYANSSLSIFNPAGQKIYEVDSYQNNWDGTLDGKPLQAGAYYYVIRLSSDSDIRGAVRIIR